MHPAKPGVWVLLLAAFAAGPLPCGQAQSLRGELRLQVEDSEGHALPAQILVENESAQVHEVLATNGAGILTVQHLLYGSYLVRAEHSGFAAQRRMVEVHTPLPVRLTVKMQPVGTPESVQVNAGQTLLEHDTAGAVNRIGRGQIVDREASLPGRGLVDLINSEPGWLYEGNAVLHPRGSEYQTQFVVDGIPLTENRSPGFGSQIEAADVQSAAVYTAGIPAEYGRKMGGVIEVSTLRDTQSGVHGEAVFSGGSFATGDGFGALDYGWGRNSAGVSVSGGRTDWYENPPVLQNYTNEGTTRDFTGDYEREWTPRDRMTLTSRHELAHFLVPNEQVQEKAGQRQDRATLETMGTAAWQHILGPTALTHVAGMVRDDTVLLASNAQSTPIVASQDRGFREGYIKASATKVSDRQDWKAGIEGDFLHVHEGFAYTLTDPSQFDPGTPPDFQFYERGKDDEGAVFAEDTARLKEWTVAAGLRWDDYRFVVHQSAWSPRLALSRYFPRAAMTAHIAYDRVFQTPAFENLLLSSSRQVVSLDTQVLREPVLPSRGNYYEAGISKAVANLVRVDADAFLRRFVNFADDNPLLDTSISFPIAMRRASIYGAEGKLSVPRWGRVSGYASYSYMVATCNLPVTGGLLLGDQAAQALDQLQGRLWVSQDQRNTVRTRWIVHLPRGFWAASGLEYGSGLPVDFDGTRQQALEQYGPALVDRVSFDRGRVDPSLAFDASAGAEWPLGDRLKMRIQADGKNLNNRINLIDFAGLFSGNAVEPPRSGDVTLALRF